MIILCTAYQPVFINKHNDYTLYCTSAISFHYNSTCQSNSWFAGYEFRHVWLNYELLNCMHGCVLITNALTLPGNQCMLMHSFVDMSQFV